MVYRGRCTNVPKVLQANSNPHPTPFCTRQRQSLKFTRSSIILVQGQNSGEASLKVACNSVLDTIGKEMLSNKDQQSPNQAGPSPTLEKNLKVKTISKHLNTGLQDLILPSSCNCQLIQIQGLFITASCRQLPLAVTFQGQFSHNLSIKGITEIKSFPSTG